MAEMPLESFAFVLFGATGDLARLKILPAFFDLFRRGLLPQQTILLANGRSSYTQESFREYVRSIILNKHSGPEVERDLTELLDRIHYLQGNLDDEHFYPKLKNTLATLTGVGKTCGNFIFHLAVAPQLYKTGIRQLGKHFPDADCGWVRILIEKPFGEDLATAKELNSALKEVFQEKQIYRIDHYLGKEPVQNILAFRFENGVFEPLLNNKHVDHIQIQMLENFGIEKRGQFYDRVGAVKDVFQNHLLQLLAVTTMEKPKKLTSQGFRVARKQLIQSLKPIKQPIGKSVVRGQYQHYSHEPNVRQDSTTETFLAMKLAINNPRWQGVPVYIRAGKSLQRTVTEIAIVFKGEREPSPNVLVLRIAPNEGIVWRFLVKRPGPRMVMQEANMQFCYKDLPGRLMEPYERLLYDAFSGDQTLFTTASETETQWKFISPILKAIETNDFPLFYYPIGSYGPEAANQLLVTDGRFWLEPSLDVCPI